jgi:hypothetical protein
MMIIPILMPCCGFNIQPWHIQIIIPLIIKAGGTLMMNITINVAIHVQNSAAAKT